MKKLFVILLLVCLSFLYACGEDDSAWTTLLNETFTYADGVPTANYPGSTAVVLNNELAMIGGSSGTNILELPTLYPQQHLRISGKVRLPTNTTPGGNFFAFTLMQIDSGQTNGFAYQLQGNGIWIAKMTNNIPSVHVSNTSFSPLASTYYIFTAEFIRATATSILRVYDSTGSTLHAALTNSDSQFQNLSIIKALSITSPNIEVIEASWRLDDFKIESYE